MGVGFLSLRVSFGDELAPCRGSGCGAESIAGDGPGIIVRGSR